MPAWHALVAIRTNYIKAHLPPVMPVMQRTMPITVNLVRAVEIVTLRTAGCRLLSITAYSRSPAVTPGCPATLAIRRVVLQVYPPPAIPVMRIQPSMPDYSQELHAISVILPAVGFLPAIMARILADVMGTASITKMLPAGIAIPPT